MRKLILIALCIGMQSAALAQWVVTEDVDAMTDEVKKTAIVENEDGHTFSIYRISTGGAVWGNFALSDGMFDQVDWRKPPIFRIDKGNPYDLAAMKRLQDRGVGLDVYAWEPKWVNFRLWHGKDAEGIAHNLVKLMEGKVVVFRYHLSTGGFKDTSFSLEGAATAIADAIGITATNSHAGQQDDAAFKQAFMAEMNRCRDNMDSYKECISKLNDCRHQVGQDTEELQTCLAADRQ